MTGSLTAALRNFVMSHSTDVYENNYMTQRVREDLTRIRFGAFAGSNDPLFCVLRDLSLQSDPGAPIEPTPKEKQSIEGRNDITLHCKTLDAARASGKREDISKAKAALDQLRRRLHVLLLVEARKRYFAEAARLRSLGLSTACLRSTVPPKRRDHQMLDIGLLLHLWTGGKTVFGSEKSSPESPSLVHDALERAGAAMKWVVNYVRKLWTALVRPNAIDGVEYKPALPLREKPTCLLPSCQRTFAQRSTLTRHVVRNHVHQGTFNSPFPCPACRTPHEIGSGPEWSNHVEQVGTWQASCAGTDCGVDEEEARRRSGRQPETGAGPEGWRVANPWSHCLR